MHFHIGDYVFSALRIKRFHDLLDGSQYWPVEKRNEWVKERLDQILLHAVKNVPYYRRTLAPFRSRFQEMVDRLDLKELPVITKDTVQSHYHELCSENLQRYNPIPTHTSGSTGTPTKFLLDKGSNTTHFASIWRVLNWAGYRFGNRFADLTGHAPKVNRFYEYNLFLNCLHFSTFNFKKDHVPLYLDKLRSFNPVLIKAYPSAIALFCRWMDELQMNSYHCDTVLTCAESLLDFQKATIKKVLHSYVYDFYNQNERAGLISTCEKESYHIHEEYSFVELLGNGSEINGQDDAKMIVATTFHNYAMPLIRYQTDDLARPTEKTGCECGRTYKTVQKIVGRINDLIVTPNGNHMSMPMGDVFDTALGIRQSQIVQECIDQICVKIVKTHSFSQKDLDLIDYSLRERLGDEMRIRYEFVDSITPGQNGKTKFIISKLGRQVFPASVPDASNC